METAGHNHAQHKCTSTLKVRQSPQPICISHVLDWDATGLITSIHVEKPSLAADESDEEEKEEDRRSGARRETA